MSDSSTVVNCSVPWCTSKAVSHGFCKPHYRRWRRTKNPINKDSRDIKGVLAVAKEAIMLLAQQAEAKHKASGHKSPIGACESGLCQDVNRLQAMINPEKKKNVPTQKPAKRVDKQTEALVETLPVAA